MTDLRPLTISRRFDALQLNLALHTLRIIYSVAPVMWCETTESKSPLALASDKVTLSPHLRSCLPHSTQAVYLLSLTMYLSTAIIARNKYRYEARGALLSFGKFTLVSTWRSKSKTRISKGKAAVFSVVDLKEKISQVFVYRVKRKLGWAFPNLGGGEAPEK